MDLDGEVRRVYVAGVQTNLARAGPVIELDEPRSAPSSAPAPSRSTSSPPSHPVPRPQNSKFRWGSCKKRSLR